LVEGDAQDVIVGGFEAVDEGILILQRSGIPKLIVAIVRCCTEDVSVQIGELHIIDSLLMSLLNFQGRGPLLTHLIGVPQAHRGSGRCHKYPFLVRIPTQAKPFI
jgi:hypothetical protein